MRILLLLTDGYGCPGGIGRVNLDLIETLRANPSVSEVVAVPRRTLANPGPLPPNLTYDKGASRGDICYVVSLLRRLLRDRRFDLVLCTHLNLQLLAWFSARLCGAPSALFLHGVEAWNAPRRTIRRFAANTADWYIAATEMTLARARTWLHMAKARSIVAPFGVDLARYSPGAASAEILDKYYLREAVVLLSLGRLAASEQYKGYDEILGILGRLRAVEPRLVYVVAGDGDDRARLEAKARDLGVAENIRFTGHVSEGEKVELSIVLRAPSCSRVGAKDSASFS